LYKFFTGSFQREVFGVYLLPVLVYHEVVESEMSVEISLVSAYSLKKAFGSIVKARHLGRVSRTELSIDMDLKPALKVKALSVSLSCRIGRLPFPRTWCEPAA
jgi:hypothetical protein